MNPCSGTSKSSNIYSVHDFRKGRRQKADLSPINTDSHFQRRLHTVHCCYCCCCFILSFYYHSGMMAVAVNVVAHGHGKGFPPLTMKKIIIIKSCLGCARSCRVSECGNSWGKLESGSLLLLAWPGSWPAVHVSSKGSFEASDVSENPFAHCTRGGPSFLSASMTNNMLLQRLLTITWLRSQSIISGAHPSYRSLAAPRYCLLISPQIYVSRLGLIMGSSAPMTRASLETSELTPTFELDVDVAPCSALWQVTATMMFAASLHPFAIRHTQSCAAPPRQ